MASLRDSKSVFSTGNVNSATSPLTVPCPSGLAVGDLLVVWVYFAQGIAGSQTAPVPDNMTKISADGTTPTRIGGIFFQVVTNPALYASGIVLNSNSAASRVVGIAEAWTPTSGKHWDSSTAAYAGPEYSAVAAGSDTFPTLASRSLMLGSVMSNKSASTTISVATAAGGGTDLVQAYSPSAASGSVSDSVIAIARGGTGLTYNINQANFRAETFGINEVDDAPPVDPLPTVTGRGFGTVKKFMQTKGATTAHRGLGGTYPEMTEYGVRMAANAGHSVIEISCQRTSDGVWIGCHDQTVDRIAVQTTFDGTPISSLTWAQIQTLDINVGSTGATRKFATLTQLVQTLPNSFVFMLDPKQSGGTTAYMTEFLDLVDTLLGPTRAFLKFDGAATPARFQAAQARGYKTSAYYYAAPDTPTSSSAVNANLPYVDMPGLNYSATQAGWDAFLWPGGVKDVGGVPTEVPKGVYYDLAGGMGKKMWGHVAETQTAYNTAISKGATYVQCTSATITAVGIPTWRPGVGANGLSPKELYAGVTAIKKQYRGTTLVYEKI